VPVELLDVLGGGGGGAPGGNGLHSSTSQLNLNQLCSLKPQLSSTSHRLSSTSQIVLIRFCYFNTQPSTQTVLTAS